MAKGCGVKPITIPSGSRFGRLVVLERGQTAKSGEYQFRCACDCGSILDVRSKSLRSGRTQSCGCKRIESDFQRTQAAMAVESARFMSNVEVREENECWLWKGRVSKKGYGVFNPVGIKNMVASRYAYLMHTGTHPGSLFVCHHCDNPPCVNPKHLFLGTSKDNAEDMLRKGRGRHVQGEQVPNAKLTSAQVADIRNSTESLRALAARLGVTYGHVGKIRRGELWA